MVMLHQVALILHNTVIVSKYISSQEGPFILEVPLKDQCYVSHFLGVNAFKDLNNFKEFIVAFKA